VVKIDESGTSIVSRPEESSLFKIFTFTNFKTITHAVGYESDRKYILFTQEASSDTYTKQAWVYNFLTGAWTKWDKDVSAAYVIPASDILYLGHAVDSYILQERKSFLTTADDYVDEDLTATLSVVDTTTNSSGDVVSQCRFTYTYATALAAGFLLNQGNDTTRIRGVTDLGSDLYECELEEYLSGLATGAATVSLPVVAQIRWAPEAAGDPTMMKNFYDCQVYLEKKGPKYHKLGFFSDVVPTEILMPVDEIAVDAPAGWGQTPYGSVEWGDAGSVGATPLRTFLPRNMRICRALSVLYRHEYARETFDITNMALTYRILSERTTRQPR
jgi:hypothetical protein